MGWGAAMTTVVVFVWWVADIMEDSGPYIGTERIKITTTLYSHVWLTVHHLMCTEAWISMISFHCAEL